MRRPSNELDDLLSETVSGATERERMAFDCASKPLGERLILHGAGRFGRRILERMRTVGLEPLAFSDNNPALDGSFLDGIPVLSASTAAKHYGDNAAFVVTVWNSAATDRMSQRVEQLKNLGCERVFPAGLLCWKYASAFLPYYPLDLPHKLLSSADEVRAGFHTLADDASRKEYLGQTRFRLLLDYDAFGSPYGADHYFESDLYELQSDEVLIDCGAFDGDTIASFVQRRGESFGSIIALEPDPLNLQKLRERLSKLPPSVQEKITALPYALGSRACTVHFDSTGTDIAKIGQGTLFVESVTLDMILEDVSPTFIKFDIEGAEMDALAGAHEVISRTRPILAVSCYHRQSHLWEIPLELARMCSDYRFFLRPHGPEGWDLLCYGVPVERLNSN
jgi:FkbM family methyltransferase